MEKYNSHRQQQSMTEKLMSILSKYRMEFRVFILNIFTILYSYPYLCWLIDSFSDDISEQFSMASVTSILK